MSCTKQKTTVNFNILYKIKRKYLKAKPSITTESLKKINVSNCLQASSERAMGQWFSW